MYFFKRTSDIAKVLSSKPLKNQKLIIRLHRGEIDTKYMKNLNLLEYQQIGYYFSKLDHTNITY